MKKTVAIILIALSIITTASCSKKAEDSKMTNNTLSVAQAQADESLFSKVCSADEALAEAKNSDTVVIEFHGCSHGKKVWKNFVEKANSGTPASVLCAHYYELDKAHVSNELYQQEKDNYPVLYFYLLEYDGKEFTVSIRDSKSAENESKETYKYLLHMTGEAPETATVREYDRYVLADDDSLTWEEIERNMVSSILQEPIRHCSVYDDYDNFYGDDV